MRGQVILEGIQGLPPETLAGIVDCIYFVCKRTPQPHAFAEEMHQALLHAELRQLTRAEEADLEDEYKDYERRDLRD